MSEEIIRAAQRAGVIPVGLIEHKAETDKHGNKVSLINMADGTKFRMVHHTKGYQYSQRMTIYAGRGKFVRVRTYASDNPTQAVTITIADYCVSWGDGDNLGVDYKETPLYDLQPEEVAEHDPLNLRDTLAAITEDNFDLVIVTVLAAMPADSPLWEFKPVQEKV